MLSRQASSPLSEKGSKKEMNNPKLIGGSSTVPPTYTTVSLQSDSAASRNRNDAGASHLKILLVPEEQLVVYMPQNSRNSSHRPVALSKDATSGQFSTVSCVSQSDITSISQSWRDARKLFIDYSCADYPHSIG